MLDSAHFLLTYTCLYECDHCFLYCSPEAEGTFTLTSMRQAIEQVVAAGARSIYLEGGEPFLYYPLMLEALRVARSHNLERGVVTNGYWAHTERDAELWLAPLAEIGLSDLSVSSDTFHGSEPGGGPAAIAARVAQRLGLPLSPICIDGPTTTPSSDKRADGAVVGGDVLFKGRAADKLIADLPRRDIDGLDSCPHEDLERPTRVHIDPFGNVFVCQGLSIGNIWSRTLSDIITGYRPDEHPVVGPLLAGGPAQLARSLKTALDEDGYVDHCHLCFDVRRKNRGRFPDILCPELVYGSPPRPNAPDDASCGGPR